jgi:hypothetical protein
MYELAEYREVLRVSETVTVEARIGGEPAHNALKPTTSSPRRPH